VAADPPPVVRRKPPLGFASYEAYEQANLDNLRHEARARQIPEETVARSLATARAILRAHTEEGQAAAGGQARLNEFYDKRAARMREAIVARDARVAEEICRQHAEAGARQEGGLRWSEDGGRTWQQVDPAKNIGPPGFSSFEEFARVREAQERRAERIHAEARAASLRVGRALLEEHSDRGVWDFHNSPDDPRR
jgi:hypothetical protein